MFFPICWYHETVVLFGVLKSLGLDKQPGNQAGVVGQMQDHTGGQRVREPPRHGEGQAHQRNQDDVIPGAPVFGNMQSAE